MYHFFWMFEFLTHGQRADSFLSVPFSLSFLWIMVAIVLTLAILHYRYTRRLESGRIHIEQELASTKLALEKSEAQLQDARDKMRSLILSDPLTGLRNRRFITEYLDKDIAHVLRHVATHDPTRALKNHIYFFLIEMDQISEINASHGMTAGDFVLKKFAKLLTAGMRKSDIPVRWSGSEFLIVCRHCERTSAQKIADRFFQDLQNAVFHWNESVHLKVTCSMGYCPFPFFPDKPELFSWEDVVHLAKKALLAAQEKGGNTHIGVYPGKLAMDCFSKSQELQILSAGSTYVSLVERGTQMTDPPLVPTETQVERDF